MDLSNLTQPCAVVADDNPMIRMIAVDMLWDLGFHIIEAETGDTAYQLLAAHYENIALLFTDVEMPGTLDGVALSRKVATSWPHISILVASGRAQEALGKLPDTAHFITKPYTVEMVHAGVLKLSTHTGHQVTPCLAQANDQQSFDLDHIE